MKILIITPYFPYPLDSGGNVAQYLLIDYLRQKHQITLLSPWVRPEVSQQLRQRWENVRFILTGEPMPLTKLPVSIKSIIRKNLSAAIAASKRIYHRFTYVAADRPGYWQDAARRMMLYQTDFTRISVDLAEAVNQLVSKESFDLIQIDFIDLIALVHILPLHIKKLFVHHEIRYVRMQQEAATLPNQTSQDSIIIMHTQLQEIALLNAYDAVIVLSKADLQKLSVDVEIDKIHYSPFPASLVTRNQINYPFHFDNKLVYLGGEDHYPNKDAIEWFIKNPGKQVFGKNPHLRLYVTGKWSEATKDSYTIYENVVFTGFVPDLSNLLQGAILIVPLRIGSGIRSKILEAVANHVPVISTTIGAEGLPLRHGHHCLLADNSAEFIACVEQLISDTELQKKLIENAAQVLNHQYSQTYCGEVRNEIYQKIIKH